MSLMLTPREGGFFLAKEKERERIAGPWVTPKRFFSVGMTNKGKQKILNLRRFENGED
jgi:hypothetical protein